MKDQLKYILLGILIMGADTCLSQNATIDSLLHLIKTTKEDTSKVNAYNNLFLEYEFEDDNKAATYLNNARELAKKIDFKKGLITVYIYEGYFAEDKGDYSEALKNYFIALKNALIIGNKKLSSSSYNNIGNIYVHQSKYSEALKSYSESLNIDKQIGNIYGVASSYNNIGLIYFKLGNHTEALKNYFASLKIKESSKDNSRGSTLINIGLVYYEQKNYSDALKNYFSALKMEEAINDKQGVAQILHNIGSVYCDQGSYSEALKNYMAALKIREEIGDKEGIAYSHNGIGAVCFSLSNFEDAKANQLTAEKIQSEIGDAIGQGTSFINLGLISAKQKKYSDAALYFTKAKTISTKTGYKECLKNAYKGLSEVDSARENFKEAFENHRLYMVYRDSLDNEETRKKTIQSQMTYDFEKKEAVANVEHKKELENQNVLAEEKSRKQKLILSLVLGSLFLVLIFAGFIFRSLGITRKQKNIIEEQKNIVEIQKQEVEHQKSIVEEHQKDIIDSIMYARRIQQSLLPTETYIEKNMNRLRKI